MEYYETMGNSEGIPPEIRNCCAADVQYFCRRVKGIIRDQKMEQSRIDTLMRRLEDGKSLVCVSATVDISKHKQLTPVQHSRSSMAFYNSKI